MDVVFVIPVWRVSPVQFHYALMFVGNVTAGLDVDSGAVRVGAIAFPVSPLGQFYLRDYVSRRQALIDALRLYHPELAGVSGTAACETLCALDHVRNTHLTGPYGARPGVRKVNSTALPSKTNVQSNVAKGRITAGHLVDH